MIPTAQPLDWQEACFPLPLPSPWVGGRVPLQTEFTLLDTVLCTGRPLGSGGWVGPLTSPGVPVGEPRWLTAAPRLWSPGGWGRVWKGSRRVEGR